MDVVMVVTQERPGGYPLGGRAWANRTWPCPAVRREVPQRPLTRTLHRQDGRVAGQCGSLSAVTDTPLPPLSCWNPGTLPRRRASRGELPVSTLRGQRGRSLRFLGPFSRAVT